MFVGVLVIRSWYRNFFLSLSKGFLLIFGRVWEKEIGLNDWGNLIRKKSALGIGRDWRHNDSLSWKTLPVATTAHETTDGNGSDMLCLAGLLFTSFIHCTMDNRDATEKSESLAEYCQWKKTNNKNEEPPSILPNRKSIIPASLNVFGRHILIFAHIHYSTSFCLVGHTAYSLSMNKHTHTIRLHSSSIQNVRRTTYMYIESERKPWIKNCCQISNKLPPYERIISQPLYMHIHWIYRYTMSIYEYIYIYIVGLFHWNNPISQSARKPIWKPRPFQHIGTHAWRRREKNRGIIIYYSIRIGNNQLVVYILYHYAIINIYYSLPHLLWHLHPLCRLPQITMSLVCYHFGRLADGGWLMGLVGNFKEIPRRSNGNLIALAVLSKSARKKLFGRECVFLAF